MDRIRQSLNGMIVHEETLLNTRRQLREGGVSSTFQSMGFLAGAAVLLTGTAGLFIYRDRRMIAQTQALCETDDRLRMAMVAGRLGSWDWNIQTGEVLWDQTRKAMFGIPENRAVTFDLFL